MNDRNHRPQTAVWYFVAATFIFAAPQLFFRDAAGPWLLPLAMAVGFGVFACGVAVLVYELQGGRDTRNSTGADTPIPPTGSEHSSEESSVRTPLLSLAATVAALLAVTGCVVAVVLQLPLFAELTIMVFSVGLLAGAGAMIGIVITRVRSQTP